MTSAEPTTDEWLGAVRAVTGEIGAHDECTDTDALAAILHSVPDSKIKKHNDTCWQTHAACLRDKIYSELGWE